MDIEKQNKLALALKNNTIKTNTKSYNNEQEYLLRTMCTDCNGINGL
jgi:hypothetical protein